MVVDLDRGLKDRLDFPQLVFVAGDEVDDVAGLGRGGHFGGV